MKAIYKIVLYCGRTRAMLAASVCGIKTQHSRAYVCEIPSGMPYWLLMRFHTPFFYIVDGVTRVGEAGQLLLQPPETPLVHGASADFASGFCNDWIYFEGEDIPHMIEELGIPVNLAFSLEDSDFVADAIRLIERETKDCGVGYCYKVSGLLLSLLTDVGRACRAMGSADGKPLHPDNSSIRRVHTALTDSYAHTWRLSEMAELSGYSVSRFCALYKKHYGISPTEYLIERRISKAKYLLLSGMYNVSETASLCGFSSVHYFSSVFKKYVGCAPTVFVDMGDRSQREESDERERARRELLGEDAK